MSIIVHISDRMYDIGQSVRELLPDKILADVLHRAKIAEGTMGVRAIDRRVARTRATLHHALLSLLQTESYDSITVEGICAKANTGRSTFYAHYPSKDALMRAGLKNLREMLFARQRVTMTKHAKRKGLTFSLTMLEHARDHAHLHRSLLGNRGGTIAFEMIRQILCDLARGELVAKSGRGSKDAIVQEFAVQYVVGAYIAILNWWLDNDTKLVPQQVDELFQRLTCEGIGRASPD